MPYIKGKPLNYFTFENLTIEDLIKFLAIIEYDTTKTSNQNIYTYDNFFTNILITDAGFKCIDSIDFKINNQYEKYLLYYKNLEIFLNNIWDYLLSNETKNLTVKTFTKTDYVFKGWATSSGATTATYQAR